MRAWRDLECADVAPAEVHAIVAEVCTAIELIKADAADARADCKLGFVGRVPNRHHVFVDVIRVEYDVLLYWSLLLRNNLWLERLAECFGNLTSTIDIVLPAKHLVDHVHVAEQVRNHPVIGLALDVVENDR